MTSLFLFISGLIIIFLVARWNRSVRLFVLLLIAYLGGIVGGSIIAQCSNTMKKNSTSYSIIKKAIPTQSAMLINNSTCNTAIIEPNRASLSGTVGFGYVAFNVIDNGQRSTDLSMPLNRGGPFWYNTS